jgi:hypothetical protein
LNTLSVSQKRLVFLFGCVNVVRVLRVPTDARMKEPPTTFNPSNEVYMAIPTKAQWTALKNNASSLF